MGIAKKGLRKITVDGQDFVYKISRPKRNSDWRFDTQEVQENFDETFVNYASYYGLGSIADASISIVVQSATLQTSRLFIKCHTIVVDGFMGIEQVLQITPKLIAQVIHQSLKDGWQIESKKDIHRDIAHQSPDSSDKDSPMIILFPWAIDGDKLVDYDNVIKIEPIKLS